ncbi:MAG TPA: TonB family protein, partial [Terriglobales bacterium]|nr:TonB family protein [Terriglobales bacterium]
KLLQVVLSGQPRLLENLSRPEQSQLRQRISMFCQIDPLAPEEVLPYLQHRSRCGDWVCEALFTPDAIEHIAILSGGSPREINNICFNALSLAIGLGLDRIDGANIREVARQLMLPNPEDAPAVAVRKARTKQSKTPVQHHPAPQIVASPIITAPLGEAHAAGAAAVPAAASAPAAMPKPAPEPQVSKPAPEVAPPRIERERTNPPQSEDEWPTSIPAWYEVKPPKHSAPSVAESFLGSDLHRRLSEDASRESSIAGNRSSALVRAIAMIALLGIAIVAYFLLPWPRLQQLVNASVPAISSTAADAAPATSEADVTTKESSPPAPKKARKTARPPSAASASISRTIARDVPIGQIDRTGIATQTDSDPNMVPRVRPPVSDAALQQVLSTAAPNVTVTAESRATSEENASTGRQPRISGGVALTTPLPKYPEEARKMHLEGTVVLAATITTTGHLRNIRPVKGNLWLARAAMTAAEGWRYEPYLVDSVPTELETEIVFHFKPDQP